MKDTLPARVRFGSFELDLKGGELRDGERRTVLQAQPFKVLLILIERNGEIATREEIKKKLWPNDTIVEFDHSINVAVGTLRRALGDSAEAPKYIETLARRGYRLMVPAERVEPGAYGPSIGEDTAAQIQHEAVGLIGKRVSHYRVLEIIGGGGMGLVYKAEDIKLGRRVALKFLPEELASDPVALQRFEREAQTASSLNHPNICTIHEVEEYEGQPFIVMELLEGETLRDRLATGAGSLPLEELLDIGIQVSDGLQAAHERGIIHRDIKPANIFLTNKRVCKILDFGLAKPVVEAPGFSPAKTSEETVGLQPRPGLKPDIEEEPVRRAEARRFYQPATPTPDPSLTRTGSTMGTAGYMSPEQVRGEKLDARSDLFSFGLVLYEMATGQRAFGGETAAVVHDAILNHSPVPVRELNSTLPAKLVTTIDRALEKDREQRYQGAAEMRTDLEEVLSGKRPTVHRPWKWLAIAALLATAAVGGWLYYRPRSTLTLTANDTIVLADFTNSTTDPVFDDALNTALRVELEQTPFLNVVAPDKVRGTLRVLQRPEYTKLTPDLAREVCRRTKSKAVVTGSINDAGNHYRIELTAADCQSGETIVRTEAEAASRNAVVRALGVAGSQLRSALGEPKASLQKFNKPLDEATSRSLEALQALAQGVRLHMQQSDAAGLPYLKRAVELDPNYAMAYLRLGVVQINLGQASSSIESVTKAFNLRERLTQGDRLLAESIHYDVGTGEVDKADQASEQWIQTFPADVTPHINLAASSRYSGRPEKAAAEAREANRLSPSIQAYQSLIGADISLGQFEQAKADFNEAASRNLDDMDVHIPRYIVAMLQGDKAAMDEQINWTLRQPGGEGAMLWLQADNEAYRGHLHKARMFSQHAAQLARSKNSPEWNAGDKANEALLEAEVGNSARARQAAMEALTTTSDRNVRLTLALAFARSGDRQQAQKLVEALNQEFPLSTWIQQYELATIRAAIELDNNHPERAIDILQSAVPYELASTESFTNYYPAYVRGLAYLAASQGPRAATEFQKLLDHPGVVSGFVTGALSHLQLGRAQVMMSDKAAARKSYQDFLTLWKDADPDIPIYKQAKAEYAKLRRNH